MNQKHVLIDTCTAENDLSTKQYYFVELSGAAQVDVCDAATDTVYGVLQDDPAAGDPCAVAVLGITKVIAGGTVAAGDRVGTTNAGKAVAKTAADDKVSGICRVGGDDGELIEILLTPGAQRSA